MHRALLIDDEPLARDELRYLLEPHPEVTVAGEAGTVSEARERLARPDYDLVFLDIQLRGGTGFDLVADVRAEARVIFVTSHDEHAVRAFEVNALDYLLKPVAAERLAAALRRAPSTEEREAALPGLGMRDLVHLKTGTQRTRFVPLTQIVALRAAENYSEVRLADGTRHLVRQTMKSWEERLPATHFVRVHRNVIIGLAHYRGADYVAEGTSELRLAGLMETVPASYRYWPELERRLAALGLQV